MTPIANHKGPLTVIIDDEELNAVRSFMTTAEFAEFLDMCLLKITRHLTELNAPLISSRFIASVHQMIGSAGAMGAKEVEAIARRLEAACEAGEVSVIPYLRTSLAVAWMEAMGELARLGQDYS